MLLQWNSSRLESPSNVNIRRKACVQSQKVTKTFGRKTPEKLAFQKYAKFQRDLAEKQKNLEVEEIEEPKLLKNNF